jgi:hypothetical protein
MMMVTEATAKSVMVMMMAKTTFQQANAKTYSGTSGEPSASTITWPSILSKHSGYRPMRIDFRKTRLIVPQRLLEVGWPSRQDADRQQRAVAVQ